MKKLMLSIMCLLLVIYSATPTSATTTTPQLVTNLTTTTTTPNPIIGFYKIVMIWPKSLCKPSSECPHNNPPQNAFNIRSVLTAYADGTVKTSCSGGDFNEPVLAPIRKRLELCWPGYTVTNVTLWSRQWYRYGRCSDMYFLAYFKKGLEFCSNIQRPMFRALSTRGIVPGESKTYTVLQFYNALARHFRKSPILSCRNYNGVNYVYEVTFCSKDLKFDNLQNCPADSEGNYIFGCGNPEYASRINIHFP